MISDDLLCKKSCICLYSGFLAFSVGSVRLSSLSEKLYDMHAHASRSYMLCNYYIIGTYSVLIAFTIAFYSLLFTFQTSCSNRVS